MRRTILAATVLIAVVLSSAALGLAQPAPYGPPPGPQGPAYPPTYAPDRVRVVNGSPAVVCQDGDAFHRFLRAYANGDRARMRETAAQGCAFMPQGSRVIVTQPSQRMDVWRSSTRERVTYRVVRVRVVSGPARGYEGYTLERMLS